MGANGAPLPTGVRMEGCPTFDCGLTIGAFHTFEINFDVPTASSTTTAIIYPMELQYHTIFQQKQLMDVPTL